MQEALPTPSASDRIAAEGIRITFGGQAHRLRFSMRSLRYLEKEFGSIEVFVARLKQTEWGEDRLRAICVGMTAGLLHEKPTEMALPAFQESIEEQLTLEELVNWIDAMTKAMSEGMPEPEANETSPKDKGSRGNSRGKRSTLPRPASSVALMRSSGS